VPNIRTFDTPQLGLQPTEIGIEATAAAARRGGTFYNQAAAALTARGQHIASATKDAGDLAINYIEHREISNGAAKLAQIEDGYTGAWQKFAADPNRDWNDPTVVQQFRAGMEPGLQQFKDSFITERGRDWAEGRVDRFREHMFSKTAADASTMSAAAIVQNKEETVNSATSRVYKDPSALDDALAGLHDSINATVDSSPTLDVGTRARTKESLFKQDEKLVKAAVMGAIRNGGDWRAIAENPKYSKYINAPEIAQFEREEKFYDRVDRAEKRADKLDADNEARSRFHRDTNDLEFSLFDDNGNMTSIRDKIAQFRKIVESNRRGSDLEPGRVSSVLRGLESMAEKQARGAGAKDDPATVDDLTNRLFDPDNPTTVLQIAVARNDGNLSPKKASNLAGIVKAQDAELKEPKFRAAISAAKGQLGPAGLGRYSDFVTDFLDKYKNAKRNNALLPNALNVNDPKSLIGETIEAHRPSWEQIVIFNATKGAGMPGEVPAEKPKTVIQNGHTYTLQPDGSYK